MEKIIGFFKKAWAVITDSIDTAEFTFFFPLSVFGLLVIFSPGNPLTWIALVLWLINLVRNYS
jgi:hypothetical protein